MQTMIEVPLNLIILLLALVLVHEHEGRGDGVQEGSLFFTQSALIKDNCGSNSISIGSYKS